MPTLRLSAEIECFPTWLEHPGEPAENVPPESLPISPALSSALHAWADRWDAIYDMDDPASAAFASEAEERRFHADGAVLAGRLRSELGAEWTVRLNPGENHAGWAEWLAAYERVYAALPGTADVPCPNCGAATLDLVFTGPPEGRVGYGAFWCADCLYGLGLCRCPVPDGVPLHSFDDAPDKRRARIPNFRLVPVDPDDDEGGTRRS